jgi:hypothetical protein
MNFAKRLLMVAGAVAVAGILGALVAPKAAHGIVATLVQVVNTSANPVPTVMSGTPFEAALCHAFGPTVGTSCGAEASDFVVPSMTSTGVSVKRLVVENVSGLCQAENTPLIAGILFSPFVADSVPNSTGAMAHYFPLTLQTTGPGPSAGQTERDYSFGGTTRIYFNPGDTVSQRVELFTPSDIDAICFTQVDGTLVTQ